MKNYLKQAISAKASDLFLVEGVEPHMRVDGQVKKMDSVKVTRKNMESLLMSKFNDDLREEFDLNKDIDFRMEILGFPLRVNLHIQQGLLASAIRIFPKKIPDLKELQISQTIQDVVNLPHGLVLVTGPAGVGKSTTLAALIEKINQEQSKHIISVEDPIEFVFQNKQSLIEQREVKIDTPTFHIALKHILRQNPDVILVGEMRDANSVSAAMTAAETGHLVFSTLHTQTAADTVERIIDLFPPEKQRQILVQLSSVLRMVVSQKLFPRKKGGLLAVREVLINTPAVANLIKNNNIAQINSVIQTSKKQGMVSMKQAIAELVKKGEIDKQIVGSY